ncbi:hypothetical protein [Domibacillus aminovorans]|uniref:Head-tail adaptor protein n=1 Tax=Domibacillus aminovorans TaxID=29332 RepID=A0A177L868_9BACI|nr:hypothetical protein [Domibacillus aminovorans]OAH61959.1 hypothetical protein AWH49_11085 [Domibacillus aminovorans]
MPEKISFASMIHSFGVIFKADVEAAGGSYASNGDWIDSTTYPADVTGVLLPFSQNGSGKDELHYSEAGTYSTKDRKLLTLVYLKLGQTIVYKGIRYTIQEFDDFTDYTDVKMYVARWVGNENK